MTQPCQRPLPVPFFEVMGFVSLNPATGRIVRRFRNDSLQSVETKLNRAQKAFSKISTSPLKERLQAIAWIRECVLSKRDEHAALITEEMGKPIQQSRAEVEKCALLCSYYIENAERFLEPVTVREKMQYICTPLGPILLIMPWNFPYWQVFRVAIPNLALGNSLLLKHSENVGGCAEALTKLVNQMNDSFQNLFISHATVKKIIRDPRVQGVSLTGSTQAGRVIGAECGRSLKKSVLELGGSDPYVILDDADLELAAKVCAQSRLLNAGQSCISAKRFIFSERIASRFMDALQAEMERYSPGDPRDEQTKLGPLVSKEARNLLHRQVKKSLSEGAILRMGGSLPKGAGFFYPSTIVTNVRPTHVAFKEEIFGPVAACIKAKTEAEAIHLANHTRFGLGAAIFSQDEDRALRLAREKLRAGNCFVNTLVRSDPRLPFGGIQDSGYGRELSEIGLKEFANMKSIVWG